VTVLKLSCGVGLRYDEVGSGQPLVLVHGSPGEAGAWARVVEHLAPTLRVRTPDLPGCGGSDPLPWQAPVGTDAVAAALAELIEDCSDPVWLCGYSYGGNVALHAALRQRERVKGLVLIEPVFVRALDLAGERKALLETHAFFTTYLVRAAFAESDAIALMIDFWLGAGAYAKLSSSVRGFLNRATARNADDVRAAFAETLTAAQLGSFDRPVLIVHGTASNPIARTIAVALAGLMPQAQVDWLAGATHAMLDSHPREVAAFIDGLCSG
jgi:pimeloyl-ACP methyl ester carboxylesterase